MSVLDRVRQALGGQGKKGELEQLLKVSSELRAEYESLREESARLKRTRGAVVLQGPDTAIEELDARVEWVKRRLQDIDEHIRPPLKKRIAELDHRASMERAPKVVAQLPGALKEAQAALGAFEDACYRLGQLTGEASQLYEQADQADELDMLGRVPVDLQEGISSILRRNRGSSPAFTLPEPPEHTSRHYAELQMDGSWKYYGDWPADELRTHRRLHSSPVPQGPRRNSVEQVWSRS